MSTSSSSLARLLPALALAATIAAPATAREAARLRPNPAAGDTIPARPKADTAGASAAQAPDTLFDRLLKLEGYTPVEYRGKTAQFRGDEGTLRLWGDAEVTRQGEKLTADSIVYQERTKITTAFGNPKVKGQAQDIEGDVLVYDLERKLARVKGGRTQFAQGTTWYVVGQDVVAEQEADRLYAANSTFTSDERPDPQYHFKADKIIVVKDRLLVGRPARLYFRNVPVAWFPFIVQDMEKGRRSGILTPRFGVNDIVRNSSGYQRQISNVGYYWAINQFMGAQLSGEWRSNSYTAVVGSLDYNWRRHFLNGNVNWREFFPDDGGRERTLTASSSWRPNERTDLSLQANYASNSGFVRDRSTDPLEATQELQSNFQMSRRFDWGQMSLGAQRRQSLATDRVETLFPSFGITPNTITLFPAASPEEARWYNNVSLTLGASGSRSSLEVPLDTARTIDPATRLSTLLVRGRSEDRANLQLSQSLTIGNLSLGTNASLNRQALQGWAGIDSASSFQNDQGQWSSNISYRQPLIGSTYIAPTLSLSQNIRRDTITGDSYVTAPLRLSFGAGVNTDLYGFFPGVGGIQTIRHHLRPGASYSYSPEARQTELQERIFGKAGGRTQNQVTLSLDQTFEAKLRNPRPAARVAPGDTAAADSAGQTGRGGGSTPAEARKVTLLALNTSAVGYDFAKAAGGEAGFITDQITNTIRSDYLQGLNLSFSHDLFEDPVNPKPGENGAFDPQLSSLNASFSFGQNSAVFRWLAGFLGTPSRESMVPGRGMVPNDSVTPPGSPTAPQTATANPQRAGGGGPWSVSLQYSLVRPRAAALVDRDLPERFRGGDTQMLSGSLSFSPTPNWSVNWNSSYSIEEREFGAHRLNLSRDLYRWEANFDFYRTPVGNTSFEFRVQLKDLPDLKFDYRERDIGVDRRRTAERLPR